MVGERDSRVSLLSIRLEDDDNNNDDDDLIDLTGNSTCSKLFGSL